MSTQSKMLKFLWVYLSLLLMVTPLQNVRAQEGEQPHDAEAHTNLLTPLYSWWDPNREDNFATTDPRWAGTFDDKREPNYTMYRYEGLVHSPDQPQPDGTIPLYSWYNSSPRADNFLTSDQRWAGRPGDPDKEEYRFVRMEGYIYDPALPQPPGSVPLYSWWNNARGDNFATTDVRWSGNIGDTKDGYALFRIEGYLLPHPSMPRPHTAETFGYGSMKINGVPAEGERPLLTVLIEYTDAPMRHTRDEFESLIFGPSALNVVDYFRANSYGKFTWRRGAMVGPLVRLNDPNTEEDESLFPTHALSRAEIIRSLRQSILSAARAGVDFASYDVNGDSRVTQDELGVLVIGAAPTRVGVADRAVTRPAGCVSLPGSTLEVCMEAVGGDEDVSFSSIAHELTHLLGAVDIYGSGCHSYETSLMSCTVYGRADVREAYHLDPWHKMQLGWIKPQVYHLDDPGTCSHIQAVQYNLPLPQPIILYDAQRGTHEYFVLEFRSPVTSFGSGYDADVPDRGLVIWYVQTDAGGQLQKTYWIANRTPHTTVTPGSDDVLIDGKIYTGPDRVLQSVVPDGSDDSILPLYRWWDPDREDNFTTTDPRWAGTFGDKRDPNYTMSSYEGLVYSPDRPQPAGTIPLYSWYSPSRADNFLTSDPRWAGRPGDPDKEGYRFVRMEGYINDPALPQPPGSVPLYSWWNPDRGDNLAKADEDSAGNVGDTNEGYTLFRLEGYLLPPPAIGRDILNFVLGAPTARSGSTHFWRDEHGEIQLRLQLDGWLDDSGNALHLRVEPMSPTPGSLGVEWGHQKLLTPYIDQLAAAAVGEPGALIALDGWFGVAGSERIVSLSDGSTFYDLPIESWSCSRISIRVPDDVPTGMYKLAVYNDAVRSAASNKVDYKVTRSTILHIYLPLIMRSDS